MRAFAHSVSFVAFALALTDCATYHVTPRLQDMARASAPTVFVDRVSLES